MSSILTPDHIADDIAKRLDSLLKKVRVINDPETAETVYPATVRRLVYNCPSSEMDPIKQMEEIRPCIAAGIEQIAEKLNKFREIFFVIPDTYKNVGELVTYAEGAFGRVLISYFQATDFCMIEPLFLVRIDVNYVVVMDERVPIWKDSGGKRRPVSDGH